MTNDTIIPQYTPQVDAQIHAEGGVNLEGENNIPRQLLNGGNHFEDVHRNIRRSNENVIRQSAAVQLPCEVMLEQVIKKDLCRPTPKKWKGNK